MLGYGRTKRKAAQRLDWIGLDGDLQNAKCSTLDSASPKKAPL